MKRSEINPMPEYYDRYINLVADVDLSQAFDDSLAQLNALDIDALTRLENKPYAEGKWTVQELLQHILDWERIFSYRALLFARNVGDPPQGIEENDMAANSRANERSVAAIIDELKTLRAGTKYLFDGFDEETLKILGKTRTAELTVGAVGFTTLGHQLHHLKIVEERYLPILNS
ncbi:MAG TPA: DinB family protein [Pyrinomonadaceae bacterium]|nr:DinB family protein [Pyrinomonadaceae bacterium]